MARTHADALAWYQHSTDLLLNNLRKLDEAGFDAASGLPGWTRKHLVAHVAANAEALGNLTRWACTGEATHMYSSLEQRNADIESGGNQEAEVLKAWLEKSASELAAGLAALSDQQWQAEVVTAQGRTVPATEIPWMRAREVYVHVIDLALGVSFADLPHSFLEALCDDAVAKRNAAPAVALVLEAGGRRWHLLGEGAPVTVSGSLAEITAYLTGRAQHLAASDNLPRRHFRLGSEG